MSLAADLETACVCDEQRQVVLWRQAEALEAGLTVRQARQWAERGGDVSELRYLCEHGCPPMLIARIVL